MPRYVPKTYNNKRALRIFLFTILAIVLLSITLFLVLFFVLDQYVVDGQLVISWLDDPTPELTVAPSSD